jgi:hypothetical protein
MGINATSSYISVYTTANRYLIADWNYLTVVNIAPNIDSARKLLYNICFRIDSGTGGLMLNYDPTTFLNGQGAWAVPAGSKYWSQSGSDTWLTDTTKNLGIGTAYPLSRLDVHGMHLFTDMVNNITNGVFPNEYTGNVTYQIVQKDGNLRYGYMNNVVGFDDPSDHENLIYCFDVSSNKGSGISAAYDTTQGDFYVNLFVDDPSPHSPQIWIKRNRPFAVDPGLGFAFIIDSDGHTNIIDGTQGSGYVFTSDANGKGTWQPQMRQGADQQTAGVAQTIFSISHTPSGSVQMFVNGLAIDITTYSNSGSSITYTGTTLIGTERVTFFYIY